MRRSALLWFGLVVMVLMALGLVVLASAGEANGMRIYHDAYFFIKRQAAYVGAGILVIAALSYFDYRNWRDHPALIWALAGVVFVLLLAVFGCKAVNGSHRWLSVGPLRLQPSELAKLVVVILLSSWLDRAGWRVELLGRGALSSFAIVGVLCVPVLLEPDFGSTLVILFAAGLIMVLAGVRIRYLLLGALPAIALVVVKVMSNPNRMARLAAFLGREINIGASVASKAADNAGYQVYSALVAIGNGGVWGVGLNQSMQKHFYLPEAHTDFILAIGAEEMGLFFSIGVVVLFSLFFGLSVYIARMASDRFGRFLALGMSSLIFVQAMANVGVVCEAFPTKGLALPFFSYGGTNMLSACFAVGTILSVGIHAYRDRKRVVRNVTRA